MIKRNQELTLEELEQKKAAILAQCNGWQRCQDGSYEMALHYAGFDAVCEEIARRKEQKCGS